ncbi:raffinose/stachyose/melibiose transport system substrate-binding protein [Virgibacillus halotolerans]|uniref:ABC transporter substrate-binding protein n=1 Tax=Virgibacillus halotolerans TaxID=1071053 RepID=UPI00196220D6|nr:extracellular solute-binding protein [Virgibacillus halotolerans]MBM7601903.1 raffinose/stachyose/melibiose transport system substrate-binding protein [Virgibacillus halotolerans]
MSYKKLYVLLFLILVSLLFAACGNGVDDAGDEGIDAVKLEMYSWRSEDRKAYEEIIDAFEKENPNIKVEFQPYDSTEYNTILTNSLVSESGPDIVQLRPYSGARTIADNGYLVSLNDLPGVQDIDSTYLDAARGSDENVYGIPLTLNSGVIFYNQNIFEELGIDPPETWEELIEVSEQIKSKGITPIAQGGRDSYLLSIFHGVVAPTAYDGNEFVKDILNGNADLTDQRMMESLDRLEELEQYLPEDFIALDDNDAQALFYSEEAAMYINGDYRLETFEKNIPDIPIGVIPGLASEVGDQPVVMNWVDGSFGVVEASENKEEALKFMEFMASKEFGQIFSDELNRVSAVEGVNAKNEVVQKVTEASEANSTPYLMLVHFGEGSPSTKSIFEDSIQGMYLGEISKEELLEEAQENAEKVAEEKPEDLENKEDDGD